MTNKHYVPNKLPYGVAAMNRLYRNYIASAKSRGYTFELSKSEFEVLTKQNCFYCGRKPNQILGSSNGVDILNGEYIYNGIDRLNNATGYTVDNIVACCKVCNRAKNSMEFSEFMVWIHDLISYQSSK